MQNFFRKMRHSKAKRKAPVIGLALGSGGGRGWVHIGIIQHLLENNIKPYVVTGTSIGAVVGGCYAAGRLEALEEWTRRLTTFRLLRFLDIHVTGGGVLQGEKLMDEFEKHIGKINIEDLPIRFGCVAAELATGSEYWMQSGMLAHALRASYAIPGIFSPVTLGDHILIDGGLINPIPITMAQSFGADIVIAVSLSVKQGKEPIISPQIKSDPPPEAPVYNQVSYSNTPKNKPPYKLNITSFLRNQEGAPSIIDTLIMSSNIMQKNITQTILTNTPPDVLLCPDVSHINFLEFDKAEELIDIGRNIVNNSLDSINKAISNFE